MSLIDYAGAGILPGMFTQCTMLDKTTSNRPDGRGGMIETWADGAKFDALILKNTTTEAQIAERQGIRELFTVVVKRGTPLKYQDAFRRDSDGMTFRVTSNPRDSEAPDPSTIQIAKVTAERWEVPS